MNGKKYLLITGMVAFLICLVAGSIFNTLAFWSDLEGMSFWGYPEVTSFDSNLDSDIKITNLNCPILISSKENSEITANFKNLKDIDSSSFIQANISMPDVDEELVRDKQVVTFSPGESQELTWPVSSENKLENNKILARIFVQQTRNSPPARTKHCGIMVWDIGNLRGSQLTTIILLFSVIGMVLGLSLWYIGSSKTMRRTNRILKLMIWIGMVLCLGLIFNILGIWLISGIMSILSIILFISIIENYFLSKVS
ncbi:MAG: hypothetical protein MUO40_06600 [Anaerolineaceae bacterium]|nr:hypothetical protein [Anaerolineaceae bacterium]